MGLGLGLEEMGTERLCAKKGRVDCGHPTPTNVVLVCVTDGVVCCTIIHVGFCLLSRDWSGHGARCCGMKRSCAMVSLCVAILVWLGQNKLILTCALDRCIHPRYNSLEFSASCRGETAPTAFSSQQFVVHDVVKI